MEPNLTQFETATDHLATAKTARVVVASLHDDPHAPDRASRMTKASAEIHFSLQAGRIESNLAIAEAIHHQTATFERLFGVDPDAEVVDVLPPPGCQCDGHRRIAAMDAARVQRGHAL